MGRFRRFHQQPLKQRTHNAAKMLVAGLPFLNVRTLNRYFSGNISAGGGAMAVDWRFGQGLRLGSSGKPDGGHSKRPTWCRKGGGMVRGNWTSNLLATYG